MSKEDFNPTLKSSLKKKGSIKFALDGIKLVFEYIYYILFKWRKFHLNDATYNYFYYPYNATWRNEREVEVPIVWNEVKKCEPEKVLEIGNVLSHYFNVKHDILDKYEKLPRIINEDATNFKTDKRYDLIVAISTFEHVGWDESPKEPTKIIKTIENLKKLLSKNGKIIFTIPADYNPELDKLIKKGKIRLNEVYFMKRISKDNKWIQIEEKDIEGIKFESPFPRANGLIIGSINK